MNIISTKKPDFLTDQLFFFINALKQFGFSQEKISEEVKENFPGLSNTQVRTALAYCSC